MTARALCALLVWLTAAPASAQDASALVEQGLALRREGRDAEAAERFRAAYAIDRSARSLAQVALAEQAAGEWVAAERDLVAAMALADPWVAEHRSTLDGALATIRSHLGRLAIVSNVAGARVFIDGREAATLPMSEPISAVVGTVVVEVRADGYVTVQRSETVTAGSLSRLSIDLVPGAGAPVATATEHIDPEITTPAASEVSPLVVTGVVTAVLTAGSLAGMIAALVLREGHVQQWNDDALCPPGLPGGRLETCSGVWSSLRTAEDWAVAAGVATGGFAIATAVFLALGANGNSTSYVQLQIGPGVAAVDLSGRF